MAVKNVLTTVNYDSVVYDYFNKKYFDIYIKLFTAVVYVHSNLCHGVLQKFYFLTHDIDDKGYQGKLCKFFSQILDKLEYCNSKTSNDIKELVYVMQHLVLQCVENIEDFLRDNLELVKEGDNLFKLLILSIKK